jgi:hypothetical protein
MIRRSYPCRRLQRLVYEKKPMAQVRVSFLRSDAQLCALIKYYYERRANWEAVAHELTRTTIRYRTLIEARRPDPAGEALLKIAATLIPIWSLFGGMA